MTRAAQLRSGEKMGTFYVDCTVQDVSGARSASVPQMLVDSGSEHTWIPATLLESIGVERQKKDLTFTMANGTLITRSIGFALFAATRSSLWTKLFSGSRETCRSSAREPLKDSTPELMRIRKSWLPPDPLWRREANEQITSIK